MCWYLSKAVWGIYSSRKVSNFKTSEIVISSILTMHLLTIVLMILGGDPMHRLQFPLN